MDNKTVAEQLTEFEGERLDINKWYLHIQDFSSSEISLFFKRIRECVLKRISSNTTKEQLEEIQFTLKGISTVELWFQSIKKENKD